MVNQRMSRLRAQIAPYKEAIAKARKEGATWGDCGRVLGIGDRQLRLAIKHCRYEVVQIPLPEPTQAKEVKAATGGAANFVKDRIAKPLPGQEQQKLEAVNAANLRALGIHVDE